MLEMLLNIEQNFTKIVFNKNIKEFGHSPHIVGKPLNE
jgi:hypothetical protein